ncbi:MAG: TetR/AcrR family transcriptional regulator [Bacteroidaceae bacterium]|nr:TetR/AcrR family transcriptional regulator [Bacteroidaceae bacterium]
MQQSTSTDTRQQVIQVAQRAFRKQGVRQFTMDNLAAELGMSKRTLYQLFADKEDLLLACIMSKEACLHERHLQQRRDTDNVLDFILRDFAFRLEDAQNDSLAFIADIKRYPRVVEHLKAHSESHVQRAVEFLQKGVEQGVFRADVDYTIFYNFASRQLSMMSEQPYFRSLPLRDIFLNVTVVFLRGCCTDRGNQLINEFLERYKANFLKQE